jgi:hypothetical protein
LGRWEADELLLRCTDHKQFEPRLPQELKDELATTRAMLHNYRP